MPAKADHESMILPRSYQTAESFDKAVAMAQEKSQPVIVYYTRAHCPPCDFLQSLLRRAEIAEHYRSSYGFTAVWGSSMGSTERESYRTRFDVQGAPTWVVFDSRGRYLCTSHGGFESVAGGIRLHDAIQARSRSPREDAVNAPTRCVPRG